MYIKIHESNNRIIVAVCDEDLIGKKFEEGNKQLEVSERFYKGEIKKEEEIKNLLLKAPIVNLIGEKSIKFGIKIGVIDKKNIIKIQGIPHAQSFTL